ncbi:MAG: TVP38/TMEM64 family protein [Candidatus Babeliales bacterium]
MNVSIKRVVIAVGLILFMILLRFMHIGDYINFDFFLQHKQHVADFIASWPIGSRLIYMLAYILVVAFAIPISIILTVVGGYFFGAIQATLFTVFSATVGAFISFLVFRYLLYDTMQAKYGKQLEPLTKNITQHGSNYILFLQLLPITPFGFIVIAASLAGIASWTFIWATAVGILPGSFIYAYAGQELGSLDSFAGIFAPKFVIPLVLLALLALVPIILRHFKIIK